MFLRNAWYAAAWSREIGRSLSSVTLLGERIVLYRSLAGTPVALEDACIHRMLPLSMGRLQSDELECGYHGLRYDSRGRCIHIPGSPRVPSSAKVRSYPAVERYGLIWIWMGEEDRATPESIMPVDHWEDRAWGRNLGGSMMVACNYLLITDNLLDPSHVAWVHQTSFGSQACEVERIETRVQSDGVVASRWMRDVEVATFYRPYIRFPGNCDRLQHYEVRYPSHAFIRALIVPAGSAAHGPRHPQAMIMDSYNFMTPVDENQTLYFWFQLRNFQPDAEEVSSGMDEAVRAAFAEDKRVLEAVHEGMMRRKIRNLDLATDRAPLTFRKQLAEVIAAEAASQGRGATSSATGGVSDNRGPSD